MFREQVFTYRGAEVRVTPTLALLNRIKARGVNNVRTANGCVSGGCHMEDLAAAHAEFLVAGGVSQIYDPETSYFYLTEGDIDEIALFQQAYVSSVLPSVDFGKKQEALVTPQTVPTKVRRKKI